MANGTVFSGWLPQPIPVQLIYFISLHRKTTGIRLASLRVDRHVYVKQVRIKCDNYMRMLQIIHPQQNGGKYTVIINKEVCLWLSSVLNSLHVTYHSYMQLFPLCLYLLRQSKYAATTPVNSQMKKNKPNTDTEKPCCENPSWNNMLGLWSEKLGPSRNGRMEQSIPVVPIFRNVRTTSRGVPKILKFYSGKFPFHLVHYPEFLEFLVEWKAPFIPHCLSSPRCINGYWRS